jgi:hypothetical protein
MRDRARFSGISRRGEDARMFGGRTSATIASVRALVCALALAPAACAAPRIVSTVYTAHDVDIVTGDESAAGAAEIARVTVEAPGLAEATKQLARRVRERGGNVARIDRVDIHVETVRTETPTTYKCGAPKAPQTCHNVEVKNEEIVFTRIEGRALKR